MSAVQPDLAVLLRFALDNMQEAVNLLDLSTGKYVYMNARQVALTGFTMDELNDLPVEEAYARTHPDDLDITMEQQQLIAEGREPNLEVEYRWKVRSGEYRWFSDRRQLIKDDDGKPIYLLGTSRDITEEKAVQREASQREQLLRDDLEALVRARNAQLVELVRQYRLLAENATDVVYESGPDKRITWVSPNVTQILGWTPREVMGAGIVGLLHTDDREAGPDGPPSGSLVRARLKSGGYRWMRNRLVAVPNGDGSVQRVIGSLTDVQDLMAEQTPAQDATSRDHQAVSN